MLPSTSACCCVQAWSSSVAGAWSCWSHSFTTTTRPCPWRPWTYWMRRVKTRWVMMPLRLFSAKQLNNKIAKADKIKPIVLSDSFVSCPFCCFTGQPSRSNPAETSCVPPGRQRPLTAPQVGVYHYNITKTVCHSEIVLLEHTLHLFFPCIFRFLSIPKGFSYLNERGYVSKQLDKWQKVLFKYQQTA